MSVLDREVDKKSFAARLWSLRNAAGLSQMEMERRSKGNFRQSHYSSWELGVNAPNALQIPALADVLAVEIWQLFEEPSDEVKHEWLLMIRRNAERRRKKKSKGEPDAGPVE